MNQNQLAQQIVMALNQTLFRWPTGLQEPILSRVVVGPGVDPRNMDAAMPWAIVHVEQGRDHAENPADLIEEARLTLYLFAGNATNQAGQAAVVGGNRFAIGSSRGMGLGDIEPLIKAQIFNQLGLIARPRSTGGQPVAVAGQMGGLLAERALDITATRIPSFPDYAGIRKLLSLNTSSGAGIVFNWSPMLSPRYDLVGYSWASAAGATAPTDPTAGTFVQADGTKTVIITILGTAITGYTAYLFTGSGAYFATLSGASVNAIASNLAADITDLGPGSGTIFTATASGNVVTVTLASANTSGRLVGLIDEGATPGQASLRNNSGLAVTGLATGQRSFSFWWAYDFTKDPWTGDGVFPVAPNAYSGYRTAQGGLVYVPASMTITVT